MSDAEQREEAVFEAARQFEGATRAAYLQQVCAADPGLRERIEGLLGALERAGNLLSESAVPPAPVAPTVVLSPRPLAGERIGRYKLLQQIGEGGSGVVYMAEQQEPVRRRVALKILKPGMDTRQVIARFEAERQALALMEHPSIAKVLDAGATEAGRPYFVMELVRGVKITDFCDENQLPMLQRLELFIQVCQAIQHAHQKGIIHRDIKPSNILVTVNDGVPVPMVIDFGIAKATTGQLLTNKTLFTAFEQFIGTPAYMSPEQALMTSVDIDTRTDIYSLGVLLYELLTGRTPFDANELLQAGLDELRRTIREKEPARPSTRLSTMAEGELTTTAKRRHTEAPKLIHLLRGDLDWIVMKCLEKDRARRYETANGVAMDIQRHLTHEPVVARPASQLYRLQKSVRRNKVTYAAAVAVGLTLLAGVIVSTSQAIRARHAELEAGRKGRKSERVAQMLKAMITSVDPAIALGRDTRFLRELLDQTAQHMRGDLNDLPEVEAELCGTLGEAYHLLGDYAKAETLDRRALALWEPLHGENHPLVAQLLNHLAATLTSQDKIPEAEALSRRALATRRKLFGDKHLAVAETLVNLSFVLRRQGKLPEAESLSREALAIRTGLLGNENREVAEAMRGLAVVLWRQKRLEEAERMLREALTMQKNVLGDAHPMVADMTEDFGNILHDAAKYAEAEHAFNEALTARRQLLGGTHPDTTVCIVMLLNTLLAQEKYAEAEPLAREVFTTREKLMPDDARTFNARSVLGGCLLGQQRYVEAEPLLLSGYEGLKQREEKIPWEGRYVLKETLKRIVQLYEATHQADKAAVWKRKLAEFDHPQK